MRNILFRHFVHLAVMVALVSCNDKPDGPDYPYPSFTSFFAFPDELIVLDSTQLIWVTDYADSIVILPLNQKVSPVDSGKLTIWPETTTTYTAIAYNRTGTATATSTVTVAQTPRPPEITNFIAQPDEILVLDSTMLVWEAILADSLVIQPINHKAPTAQLGYLYVHPDSTTTYTAYAYNRFGQDTATLTVNMRVISFRVLAPGGQFYRGEMGSNILDNPLTFEVTDSTGTVPVDTMLYFNLIEGDGLLSHDSGATGPAGQITLTYDFSGDLGHATVRARLGDLDSIDVYLRANTLIPGNSGQVQYVLLDGNYKDVKNFNGVPASVDIISPSAFVVIANYEAELGLAVLILDPNTDGLIYDTSSIYAAFVMDSVFIQPGGFMNQRYEGTTAEGIGIGSSFRNDLIPVYGNPDDIYYDNSDPGFPAIVISYDSIYVTFWCHPPNATNPDDTVVFQIDFYNDRFQATPGMSAENKQDFGDLWHYYLRNR